MNAQPSVPAPSPLSSVRSSRASHEVPDPSVLLIAGSLILLWGYAVYRLGTLWHSNKDYSFGWFVPLLAGALIWERWTNRPVRDISRPAEGTFLLLGACALITAIGAVFLEVIPVWRFAGWIFAVPIIITTIVGFYFLGGRSWSRHFAFPILFILVAVPWPTRFEQPLINLLSQVNASVSVIVANLLGVVAMQHGVLIETGGGFVGVDDACSGIRSFQSSVMVALFLGELFRYSPARRLLLLFSAVLFAFACNIVRTTYLVCTCDLKGLAAVNLRHDEAGFTILGATLVGLLAVAWSLRPRKHRERRERSTGQRLRSSTPSPAVDSRPGAQALPLNDLPSTKPALSLLALLAVLLWLIVVEAAIEFRFRPVEHQATSGTGWTLKLSIQNPEFSEKKIPETMRNMLDYDEGKSAQWRDVGGQLWQMFYFRWLPASNRYRATETANQAYGHAPDICLRSAGMILVTNFGIKTVELNGVRLRVYIEKFLAEGRYFHVATCNWEPVLLDKPSGQPTTGRAIRQAMFALKYRDRGRFEKRVLKVGVWDMEKDDEAQAAIQQFLLSAVTLKS